MQLQVGNDSTGNHPAGRSNRPAAILDSPTLARVERAMLRHEEGTNRQGQDIARAQYTQSLLPSFGKETAHVIKRGLLWQQRDKFFSRWKERYFILTRDYLYVFRRASGTDRISEMGQFIFKVKLTDLVKIEWENKKTYSTVALILGRDGKIYLRSSEGLEDWFELLEECMFTSKEKRKAMRYSHNDGKPRDNNNVNNCLDEWKADRHKIPMGRLATDNVTTRQEAVRKRPRGPKEEEWEPPTLDYINRLSLLTDIDISTYDDSTLGAPSVTSYRMNDDVFCVQPPSLRAMGSFRSSRDSTNSTSKRNPPDGKSHYFKFRERSYSDIQRV
nr:uncharacterized protein LOC111507927 isoform X1 [Leptinotarsa decemlineata]XP_023019081.1 uncharacterized protein LOC111507927 isoform X2 [Leptinotarsa decemlineata]